MVCVLVIWSRWSVWVWSVILISNCILSVFFCLMICRCVWWCCWGCRWCWYSCLLIMVCFFLIVVLVRKSSRLCVSVCCVNWCCNFIWCGCCRLVKVCVSWKKLWWNFGLIILMFLKVRSGCVIGWVIMKRMLFVFMFWVIFVICWGWWCIIWWCFIILIIGFLVVLVCLVCVVVLRVLMRIMYVSWWSCICWV